VHQVGNQFTMHSQKNIKLSVNCTTNLMRVRQHPSDIWSPVHTLNANYSSLNSIVTDLNQPSSTYYWWRPNPECFSC